MNYQKRDKFFYAIPRLFPEWPYPSRYALGLNLNDFSARNAPIYRFQVKDKMYEITKEKAHEIGKKYVVSFGKMPHLIPLEEFTEVNENIIGKSERKSA